MACQSTFKERLVQLNNMQFERLINLGLQVAERTAESEELQFVDRMKRLDNEEFWPGRGFEIDIDFPGHAEQKFWCRVFFDTARVIFDRQLGEDAYHFWQAQTIHQAYATALLFQHAVREVEPRWMADSLDRREADRFYNDRTF